MASKRIAICGLAAVMASAQRATGQSLVTLAIHPAVGDTIRIRFDEQRETTLRTKVRLADTSVTAKKTMLLLSHAIVTRSDESGTTVWNTTDSIAMSATRGGVPQPVSDKDRHALQGHRIQMHLSPQGSATIVEGANDMPEELQSLTSQMAATLPMQPVGVGQTWSQVMVVPLPVEGSPVQGGANGLTVRTIYRLDSLARGGGIAFISMKGVISRDSAAADLGAGTKMTSSGTISGAMRFDRKRGWWTEVVSTTTVSSVMHISTSPDPIYFHSRITQRMSVP
ncbi:MAG: DUF6263 family protein [Gemmatimonadaceae bacterium]